jgi:hypothetical protein
MIMQRGKYNLYRQVKVTLLREMRNESPRNTSQES